MSSLCKWKKVTTPVLEKTVVNFQEARRQRISIARAILHNPPILILDEATSALDAESCRKAGSGGAVQVDGEQDFSNHCAQLSTIQYADEIVAMEGGKITERGNHLGLMAQNGIYKKLHEMQMFV